MLPEGGAVSPPKHDKTSRKNTCIVIQRKHPTAHVEQPQNATRHLSSTY